MAGRLNSLVLSDAERASVSDLVIGKPVELFPRANFFDSNGTPHFVGSTPASADFNQWTIDISHNLSSPPKIVTIQDSNKLRGSRELPDFEALHRVVLSAIYELPFKGNSFVVSWQLAVIASSQSGNPVNIITTNSTVNGGANTLRPDVVGPVEMIGSVDRWFAFRPKIPARRGSCGSL